MTMISVEQAKQLIKKHLSVLPSATLPLELAFHNILSEDVFAPIDLPVFAQSGMDGYAFCFEEDRVEYSIVGEVAAGAEEPIKLHPGEAVRIFTGAPVPAGADTIIMQEKTEVKDHKLFLKDEKLQRGHNYRPVGSDIQRGELAIKAGHQLTPAAVGFLAAMGKKDVHVTPSPKVAIIVTGDELQPIGQPLSFGQIYEANSYSLRAALQSIGIHTVYIHTVEDDPLQLEKCIKESLHLADLILITGGVSVGDYDYTLKACLNAGVKTVFHGIKQKPGKPLLFGMNGYKPVFGLPGNPSSVLTCFYQYVFPAIGQMMNKDFTLAEASAVIQDGYKKPLGITHFLRATFIDGKVRIRNGQESYKLESFANADAFIVLPEEKTEVHAGEQVIVQKIPIVWS